MWYDFNEHAHAQTLAMTSLIAQLVAPSYTVTVAAVQVKCVTLINDFVDHVVSVNVDRLSL